MTPLAAVETPREFSRCNLTSWATDHEDDSDFARRLPPRLERVESALDSYAVAIAMVRDEGLTRRRQTDATERFFALCFALEQMRRNFCGLIRRGREWARSPGQMSYATAYTGDW